MKAINLYSPTHWKDYELLDCGNFKKLERFGKYVLIRPEPQAIWPSGMGEKKWESLADVEFIPSGSHSGKWKKRKNMPDNWKIQYKLKNNNILSFHLSLTSFKHVGIFPEQSINWDKISAFANSQSNLTGLNLFAYTGGATLAANASGIRMTHVDSIKQVVSWANRNRELSDQPDTIRWMVDDAFSFVEKEVRRKNMYDFIVLDPPSYGHGPKGEKWKLEDQLQALTENVVKLLNPNRHFMIMNVYSLGLSSLILYNLLLPYSEKLQSKLEIGEIAIRSQTGKLLPLGNVAWLSKF
jgi:23S rRNA (cytosine1962-C5)-methyltransferase